MTKFIEYCNQCESPVLCECPYCEELLKALREILDEIDKTNHHDPIYILDKILGITQNAIKEAG